MYDQNSAPYSLGQQIVRNMAAGLRLASGQAIAREDIHCSLVHALIVLALGWIAVLVEQAAVAGVGAQFWIWGVVTESARSHIWLAALALIAVIAARGTAFVTLVVALGWANLPIWLMVAGLFDLSEAVRTDADPRYEEFFLGCVLAWHCLVFSRALVLLAPLSMLRAGAGLIVYAGALVVAMHVLPNSPMFYQQASPPPSLDIEAIYYQQPALVDDALNALTPQDPQAIDIYFIGVGAFASEDVFMREVEAARTIVDQRLHTRGRSLSLINNIRTHEALPLANRYNLERAIDGVASQMDRSQDVLLLFATSHGSEDASLAVDFADLGMGDIYAQDIRAMLDKAGILWRVVIVSACYSGSFIDALRGPTTIVMTAAAANRTSFGCSSENAWTYFGQAYFAEALARTTDLIEAFKQAKASITVREKKEDKEPSHPQLWVGPRIAEQLSAWRAALKEDSSDWRALRTPAAQGDAPQ